MRFHNHLYKNYGKINIMRNNNKYLLTKQQSILLLYFINDIQPLTTYQKLP